MNDALGMFQNGSIGGKKALLLDMNSTFMFGEDRLDEAQDFSIYYSRLGGALAKKELTTIMRAAYDYLDVRYPDERYRHCFPSVRSAVEAVAGEGVGEEELVRIIDTFAFHELGAIPQEYVRALVSLRRFFTLAVVIDIWAPKEAWLHCFDQAGVASLFSAMSFSSDHGMVKPSPKPFWLVLGQLGISASQALVIGDSARRDLGGARAAGIDCVLVGGAQHPDAVGHFENLLEFCKAVQSQG